MAQNQVLRGVEDAQKRRIGRLAAAGLEHLHREVERLVLRVDVGQGQPVAQRKWPGRARCGRQPQQPELRERGGHGASSWQAPGHSLRSAHLGQPFRLDCSADLHLHSPGAAGEDNMPHAWGTDRALRPKAAVFGSPPWAWGRTFTVLAVTAVRSRVGLAEAEARSLWPPAIVRVAHPQRAVKGDTIQSQRLSSTLQEELWTVLMQSHGPSSLSLLRALCAPTTTVAGRAERRASRRSPAR